MDKLDLSVLQAECFGMQRALLSEYDPDTKKKRDFLAWTRIDGLKYVEHMILRLKAHYGDDYLGQFDFLREELGDVVGYSAPESAIGKIVSAFVDCTRGLEVETIWLLRWQQPDVRGL